MAETRVVNKYVRRNDSSFASEEELIAKSEVQFRHQRGLQAPKIEEGAKQKVHDMDIQTRAVLEEQRSGHIHLAKYELKLQE